MKELLKQTIEEILKTMGFEGQVVMEKDDDDLLRANIETEEAPFLIGQAGANLFCLQQIVARIMHKKTEEEMPFMLDVNNYRKHKIEILKELAQSAAEKVLAEGRPFLFQPMNAFERRVIHTALAGFQNLSSESQGEEPNRRIAVRTKTI